MTVKNALLLLVFLSVNAVAADCPPILPFLPCTPVKAPEKPSHDVTVYGEITNASAIKTVEAIQLANKEKTNLPIFMYISSGGGSVAAGGFIIDAMNGSRRPVYTVDISEAFSMAAWIELYGKKRFMSTHAILMLHNASTGMEDDLSHINSRLTILNKIVEGYNKRVAELSGLPLLTVKYRENEQWWMLADEALAAKLIDGILNPTNIPLQ